jgi:hypothetical protein
MAGMDVTLALLGGAAPKRKNRGGRPTKASMGLKADDFPGWMFFRDCVVLAVVERERAAGQNRNTAIIRAVNEWKALFPTGRLSSTEVDNILKEYQSEKRPDIALRASNTVDTFPETELIDGKLKLTGRWLQMPSIAFRFDDRPPYPKRGSGRKQQLKYSDRFK